MAGGRGNRRVAAAAQSQRDSRRSGNGSKFSPFAYDAEDTAHDYRAQVRTTVELTPAGAPPRITVIDDLTVLFTDLVGSTDLYRRFGDVEAALRVHMHFDELRRGVELHEGQVVKTMGDAIMAVFKDPVRAVSAALELHENLRRLTNDDHGELLVRVGLHRGKALQTQAGPITDYYGQTVNVAARMQQLSRAGEIRITHEVLTGRGVLDRLAGGCWEAHPELVQPRGLTHELRTYRLVTEPTIANP